MSDELKLKIGSSIIRWADNFVNNDDLSVAQSTIKVNIDGEGVLKWVRFTAIIRIDIDRYVRQGDIPHWAIQKSGYEYDKTSVHYVPNYIDVRDIGSASAVMKPAEKVFFQRYYRIGVPFEIVEGDDDKPTAIEVAMSVKDMTESGAYKYLDENGYTEAKSEPFRYQLTAWNGFPEPSNIYTYAVVESKASPVKYAVSKVYDNGEWDVLPDVFDTPDDAQAHADLLAESE